MPIRRALLPPILAVLWAAAPGPAAADCEPAGPPEEVLPTAEVAFVGRVAEVDGAVARFAVSEVWAGEIGEVVEIRGVIDEPPNVVGEDDRQWTVGGEYLVIPFVDGPVLRDHICTATTEWSAELEALRPGNATELTGTAEPLIPLPVVFVVVALAAIIATSTLAFRRSRT